MTGLGVVGVDDKARDENKCHTPYTFTYIRMTKLAMRINAINRTRLHIYVYIHTYIHTYITGFGVVDVDDKVRDENQ
jgi:hypothetical protein